MSWFLNKKIATKLMTAFSIVLLMSLFVGGFAIQRLAAVQATAEDLGGNQMQGTRALGDLESAVSAYRRWELRLLIVNGNPSERQIAEDGLRKALETVKETQ